MSRQPTSLNEVAPIRFRIRPGCTGLWKLYAARDGVTFNDTVLYDIYYSRNMSPTMDLMVIYRNRLPYSERQGGRIAERLFKASRERTLSHYFATLFVPLARSLYRQVGQGSLPPT